MCFFNFRLFIRSLFRNKLYSGITVLGYAVALAFVFLLSVYVRQELSVDDFHANKDRIYRLITDKYTTNPGTVGPMLQQQFPEVESFSRMLLEEGALVELSPTEKISYTLAYVDPAFFQLFSFRLLKGDAKEVMQERRSVVIGRSLARRLFGEESPIGKEMTLGQGIKVPITGVMEDFPENTHMPKLDALVNIAALTDYWNWKISPDILDHSGMCVFNYYFLKKPGTDLKAREADVLACLKKNIPVYQSETAPLKAIFEPLGQIYFSAYRGTGFRQNSSSFVWTLGMIAVIILLLAVINYVNLSIAQGGLRAKEMSVKKLLGSSRKMLFAQFIGESVILCLIASGIAVVISLLAEPEFNRLLATHIGIENALTPEMIGGAIGIAVLLGIFSGWVPAVIITRFNAIEVMKGVFRKKSKGVYGKVLICVQYAVAITLTICTVVLVKQTRFMLNYDLGFNKENLVRFEYILDPRQKENLRQEIMSLPGVKEMAFVHGAPIDGSIRQIFEYEGKTMEFQSLKVDTSFFRMLGLQVSPTGLAQMEGGEYTSFTMSNGKSQLLRLRKQSVWLTDEAVKVLELGDRPLEFTTNQGKEFVRGIVKDFHITDVSRPVQPLIISPLQAPETPTSMWVQLQGSDQVTTFQAIQKVYKKFTGGAPFDSGFVDDAVSRWYEHTERVATMVGNLCILALLLSAMGILAMATYFIQQRVKEIGIRRVNGATIREVLQMLMNGFMKWILIAFVVACPIGYYAMTQWLNNFAYKTSMDWWIFAVSGIFALLIAGLMIYWQSWKAAAANPVEALKTE